MASVQPICLGNRKRRNQRLDVSHNDDCGRIRNSNGIWAVMGMFRRLGNSLFMEWRSRQRKPQHETTTDFQMVMAEEHRRRDPAHGLVQTNSPASTEAEPSGDHQPSKFSANLAAELCLDAAKTRRRDGIFASLGASPPHLAAADATKPRPTPILLPPPCRAQNASCIAPGGTENGPEND